jgi:hypothetical protein
MPSPFPGMDPYIEPSGLWGDFHAGMNSAIRAELNARLPEGYVASHELFVWFHEPEAEERVWPLEPDVYLVEKTAQGKKSGRAKATVTAPAKVVLPSVERKKHRYIKIRDTQSRRVITVIEVLSPSNKKAGDDREAYLLKRGEDFVNRLNVVEIDLLRGGRRLPLGSSPPVLRDYYVLVSRSWEWPRADIWPFALRDPLPEIPIPLRADIPDVLLPLKKCVDRSYDEGRYDDQLDYTSPFTPQLRRPDGAWAKQLLADRLKLDR